MSDQRKHIVIQVSPATLGGAVGTLYAILIYEGERVGSFERLE
jgi:hypothetical protein